MKIPGWVRSFGSCSCCSGPPQTQKQWSVPRTRKVTGTERSRRPPIVVVGSERCARRVSRTSTCVTRTDFVHPHACASIPSRRRNDGRKTGAATSGPRFVILRWLRPVTAIEGAVLAVPAVGAMTPNSQRILEAAQGLTFCFLLFLAERVEKLVRGAKLVFKTSS